MEDADTGDKSAADKDDSDEEWGNWSAGGKKEGAEGEDEKKAQEPAPFTRILLKGKGKGNDGGRTGGRRRDRGHDRGRRHRDHGDRRRGKAGGHGGKGYFGYGKNGKNGKELFGLFMKKPGQVVPPKARPGVGPAPPKMPPPQHLLQARPGVPQEPRMSRPVVIRPVSLIRPRRPLDDLLRNMEWRPPPPPVLAPGAAAPLPPPPPNEPGGPGAPVPAFSAFPTSVPPPPRPHPKIRPTQKRAAPSDVSAGGETKRARSMKNVFADELQEWLSEMDRGRGVMLRYEEALLQYSGWEELLERGADKSYEETLIETIDFETRGHLLMFQNGVRKKRQSLNLPEDSSTTATASFTKPRAKAMPVSFIKPVPKARAPAVPQAGNLPEEAEAEEGEAEEGEAEEGEAEAAEADSAEAEAEGAWEGYEYEEMDPMYMEGEGGESEVDGEADEEWQDLEGMEPELQMEEDSEEVPAEETVEDPEEDETMQKLWKGVLSPEAKRNLGYEEAVVGQDHEEGEEDGDEFEEVMVEEEQEPPVGKVVGKVIPPPKKGTFGTGASGASGASKPPLPKPALPKPPSLPKPRPPTYGYGRAVPEPSVPPATAPTLAPSGSVIPKLRPAVRPALRPAVGAVGAVGVPPRGPAFTPVRVPPRVTSVHGQ